MCPQRLGGTGRRGEGLDEDRPCPLAKGVLGDELLTGGDRRAGPTEAEEERGAPLARRRVHLLEPGDV